MAGMKSGILKETDGFDIIINGVFNSFRDRKEVAYVSAVYAKQKHPGNIVEVRHRDTGDRYTINADGTARRSDVGLK
jgi:hypothetical protein